MPIQLMDRCREVLFMSLSAEECQLVLMNNAVDAATLLMLEHGRQFMLARTQGEAYRTLEHVKKLAVQFDSFIVAAASMMQNHPFFHLHEFAETGAGLSRMLMSLADDLYYDAGDTDQALVYYQLNVGLNPRDELSVRCVLNPCLQGTPARPHIALPYAVFAAHLNPKHGRDVERVIKMIEARK